MRQGGNHAENLRTLNQVPVYFLRFRLCQASRPNFIFVRHGINSLNNMLIRAEPARGCYITFVSAYILSNAECNDCITLRIVNEY